MGEAPGSSSCALLEIVCRWCVFAAFFTATVLPSYLPLQGLLGDSLFFWFVTALAPTGFVVLDAENGAVYLLDRGWIAALVFWGAVGMAYSVLGRGLRLLTFALLAIPVMLLAASFAMLLMRATGFGIYWPA